MPLAVRRLGLGDSEIGIIVQLLKMKIREDDLAGKKLGKAVRSLFQQEVSHVSIRLNPRFYSDLLRDV